MRASAGTSKAITGATDFQRSLNKGIDKLSSWMRSRGIMPQEGYDIHMKKIGALSKDTKLGESRNERYRWHCRKNYKKL